MLRPTPLYEAEQVMAAALIAAVRPAVASAGASHAGVGRAWWRIVPPELGLVAQPYVIVQPQSDISPLRSFSALGAEALILVKALAPTASQARSLANAAARALSAPTASGYVVSASYERSPTLPFDGLTWQAGHLFRVRVARTPTVAVPASIGPSAALGAPTLIPGALALSPASIGPSAALGAPTLIPGALALSPASIGPSAALGAPTLLLNAVPLLTLGTPYTQDFDSLANSGTPAWVQAVTIPGWYATQTANPPTTLYRASAGGESTAGLYSFGAAGSTERAIGSIGGSAVGVLYYGVRLRNATGDTITRVDISYTGEQWRNGGAPLRHRLDFTYQIGATALVGGTWIDVNELDFEGPIASSTAGALDGNNPANQRARTASITLTLADGEEIWLRWADINDTGGDHALAVDDLRITPYGATGNQPIVPDVGAATWGVSQATGDTRAISASDPDGIVTSVAFFGSVPAGYSLANVVPATTPGGTLTADLVVAAGAQLGNGPVTIRFTNNDAAPQTGDGKITVTVSA